MSDVDVDLEPGCEPVPYGPCGPYVLADEVVCPCDVIDPNDEGDAALWERMLWHASLRTWEATDGRFTGCCETTIRPCRMPVRPRPGLFDPASHLWPWDTPALPMVAQVNPELLLVNCWACTCGLNECGCRRLETIRLPWLPVRSIVEVKIDGVVLDPSAYRLMPGTNVLARIDGEFWPTCQNQALPDTEEGTWSVTFKHGADLPDDGKDLVAGFACALSKRCKGKACGLPDGILVVERPGVKYAVVDPQKYRQEGLTGYAPLDDWIMALRGGHARQRPRMWTQFDQPTAMRG